MNEGHYNNVPGRKDLLSVTKMSVMVPTSWRLCGDKWGSMGKVLRTGRGTEQMMHVLVAYTLLVCSAPEMLMAGIYTEATWAAKN